MDVFDDNPKKILIFLLTFIFLVMYYVDVDDSQFPFLYGKLENAYYQNYWVSARYDNPSRSEFDDLLITVHIPAYVSTVNDAELLVTIENQSVNQDWEGNIVVNTQSDVNLLMRVINDDAIAIQGKNAIAFAPIVPHTTVSKGTWLRIAPGSNDALPKIINFTFEAIKICEKVDQSSSSNDVSQPPAPSEDECNGETAAFTPTGVTYATINSNKTIAQSFIKKILLPPWSNGVLFATALVSSGLIIWAVERKRTTPRQDTPIYRFVSKTPPWLTKLILYSLYIGIAIWLLISSVNVVVIYMGHKDSISRSTFLKEMGVPLLWPLLLIFVVYVVSWFFAELDKKLDSTERSSSVDLQNQPSVVRRKDHLKNLVTRLKRKIRRQEDNNVAPVSERITQGACQKKLDQYQNDLQNKLEPWDFYVQEAFRKQEWIDLDDGTSGQIYRELNEIAKGIEILLRISYGIPCYKGVEDIHREVVSFLTNIEKRFKTLLLRRTGQQLTKNIELLKGLFKPDEKYGPSVNYYKTADLNSDSKSKQIMRADEALPIAQNQLRNFWERKTNECLKLIDEGIVKCDPTKIDDAKKDFQDLPGRDRTITLGVEFPEELIRRMETRLQEINALYKAMKSKEAADKAFEDEDLKNAFKHLQHARTEYCDSDEFKKTQDKFREKASEQIDEILDRPDHTEQSLDDAAELLCDNWLKAKFEPRIQELRDVPE